MIPRRQDESPADRVKARTGDVFGYQWTAPAIEPSTSAIPWHYVKMERALALAPLRGLVLDAGCGDGLDLANQALRPETEVIGVELSDGGVAQSWRRAGHLPRAHLVQGDLCRLPFAPDSFDAIYSYGVVHHIPHPDEAVRELARVARPGAPVAVYVYEDFVERSAALHLALKAVNALRAITTRLSPRALLRVSRMASPLVFALCTVPYNVLQRFSATRRLADSIPYRHATGPFTLAGDLFDRFGAPVEYRYTRSGAASLMTGAGLEVTRIANDRGWMVAAVRSGQIGSVIMHDVS
jgi:SAM-dependent methyltransferase